MSRVPPPPDLSRVHLGYIPLTDAAPHVVALEYGHLACYGSTRGLARQASWAVLRDKLAVGRLDGASKLGRDRFIDRAVFAPQHVGIEFAD
jgi:ABC-type nitrate/sulfonate/bicarbonate transport system substrate-binding protein